MWPFRKKKEDKYEPLMKDFIAEIKRVNPESGDLLIIRYRFPMAPYELHTKICRAIRGIVGSKAVFIILPDNITIESVPESEMNAAGWYRK